MVCPARKLWNRVSSLKKFCYHKVGAVIFVVGTRWMSSQLENRTSYPYIDESNI